MSKRHINIENLRVALKLAIETLSTHERTTHGPEFKSILRAGFEDVLSASENRGEFIVITGQYPTGKP